jgi:hypothetical protein
VERKVDGVCSRCAALYGAYANAGVIITNENVDFSTSPFMVVLGGGLASYTFAYLGYDGSTYTVDSVATGGNALVNSSGFPGPGQQPIPFSGGTDIGNNGYDTFTAFPVGAGIAYSIADDFIGLFFTLNDGQHYGYAEVAGATLVRFAYETDIGTPITTGADATPVPEPSSWAIMASLLGIAGAASLYRRRRIAQAQA